MSVEIFNKLLEHRLEFMGMLLQGRLVEMNFYSFQKMQSLNLDHQALVALFRGATDEQDMRTKLIDAFQGDVKAANGFALGIQVQDLMVDYLQVFAIEASHENPAAMEFDIRRARQESIKNLGELYQLGEVQTTEIVRRFETAVKERIAEIQGLSK